eukprot:gb/GECG01005804.1/.p1 GENE.gb/GECG01005804.1/~~gb/GECG01005804.1/.p1  ORF type:complete len:248 (+),score=25.41 gb/GECG01005804.1/:1-744(+)
MRLPIGIRSAIRRGTMPALVAVSSSLGTCFAAGHREGSHHAAQQETHKGEDRAKQELAGAGYYDTSKSRREQITDQYIRSYFPGDDNLKERIRSLVWNAKFLDTIGGVYDQHACDSTSKTEEDPAKRLRSRKKLEKAFDEACLSHVFPMLCTALDRPITQRVATLEELKRWMVEIKGDDTFELSKEEFTFLVQRFMLVLVCENPPVSKRSWINEIWAIDSPQAFMQIGGLSILLVTLIARSKRLLGK